MGLTSILRGFAAMLFIIGAAMAAPFLVAVSGGEDSADAYLFSMALCLLSGAAAMAASVGRAPPSDFRGALLIILLWWTVAPLFAAAPFAMSGAPFADAYFEAVAALTTTGGWLSREGALASPAGTVWRALLQWLGGLASIAIAAAIFIRPAFIGIDTLLPPFPRGEKASFLRPLRNAASSFFLVYAFLTAVAFTALVAAGASAFDAAVMGMSIVASGGFVPHAEGLAGYEAPVLYALTPFLILSGANFVLIARLMGDRRERVRDVENASYVMILIGVTVLFWVAAGAGDMGLLIPQFFNAASFMSTNGVAVGEPPPIIAAMVTAIIGGAAVSTAGGFKILRWLVIMRRAREEIRRLVTPSGVFGQARVGNELGVWIHFIVFTMTLAALVVSLSIGGYEFSLAAAAAVAALSNTGPLIYLAEGGAGGYAVFDEPLRWLLVAGMILGRLEAAVALALFNRAFWRT